jgi:hypothetical protein
MQESPEAAASDEIRDVEGAIAQDVTILVCVRLGWERDRSPGADDPGGFGKEMVSMVRVKSPYLVLEAISAMSSCVFGAKERSYVSGNSFLTIDGGSGVTPAEWGTRKKCPAC